MIKMLSPLLPIEFSKLGIFLGTIFNINLFWILGLRNPTLWYFIGSFLFGYTTVFPVLAKLDGPPLTCEMFFNTLISVCSTNEFNDTILSESIMFKNTSLSIDITVTLKKHRNLIREKDEKRVEEGEKRNKNKELKKKEMREKKGWRGI